VTAPSPIGCGWVRVDQAAIWTDTATAEAIGTTTAMRITSQRFKATGELVMMIELGEIDTDSGDPADFDGEPALVYMPLEALYGLRQLITRVIESAK
jgi:hypothetical protein